MAGHFLEDSLKGTGDATGEIGVSGSTVDDGALALVELAWVHAN